MVDHQGLCSISFDHGKDAIDYRTIAVKSLSLCYIYPAILEDLSYLIISCSVNKLY